MLNFRYHALSLVAVFLSLAIGLLLGVAIGDKGLVSSAESDVRASLRGDVRQAQAERDAARAELQNRQQFERAAYPGLVGERLAGKRIALIELGGPSDRMWNLTNAALQGSGARLTSVSVIREPLELSDLGGDAHATRYQRLADDASLLHPFGTRIGIQFTHGGSLLASVRHDLLTQGSGTLDGADGIVLVRDTPTLPKDQADQVATFEDGLVRGLRADGVPVVGVETTDAEVSQIGWFKSHDLSSVDDLDDTLGRAAVVFVLAGERGSFGVKATADGGRLPPLLQ